MNDKTFIGLDNVTGQQKTSDITEQSVIAKGTTMQSGTLNFVGNKKMSVTFNKPFLKIPRFSLVAADNATVTNPYTTAVSKTGFSVNFTQVYNGTLEYIAIERE